MLQFKLEVNVGQLTKLAKKVNGLSKRVLRRVFDTVELDLNLARADMIKTYLSGAQTTSRTLARRSGNLAGSWRVAMKERAQSFEARMFQDQRFKSRIYAPVHEFGATITAKRVRYLAIPLNEEARQAGTPRKFDDLFVLRSSRGNLLLARETGEQIQPMYKLQSSVTIPPRPFVRPTSEKWFPIILRDMRREVVAVEREFRE